MSGLLRWESVASFATLSLFGQVCSVWLFGGFYWRRIAWYVFLAKGYWGRYVELHFLNAVY